MYQIQNIKNYKEETSGRLLFFKIKKYGRLYYYCLSSSASIKVQNGTLVKNMRDETSV